MNYLLNTYHHLSCCNLKLQHYIRKFSLLSNVRPILMFYAAKFRLKKRNTTRATEPVGFRTQKQTEPVYASDRLSGPKLLRNWSLSGYCCLLYCSRGVAWGRFCGFSRLCICQPPPLRVRFWKHGSNFLVLYGEWEPGQYVAALTYLVLIWHLWYQRWALTYLVLIWHLWDQLLVTYWRYEISNLQTSSEKRYPLNID